MVVSSARSSQKAQVKHAVEYTLLSAQFVEYRKPVTKTILAVLDGQATFTA